MSVNFVDLSDIVLRKLNSVFFQEKLSILDRHPVIIRHTEQYLLNFVGSVLSKVSHKGFDVVVCKNAQELDSVLQNYKQFSSDYVSVKKPDVIDLNRILNSSLQRVKRVWNQGEYSILGDVMIVWPNNFRNPVRISLFDQTVESIEIIDMNNFSKINSLDSIEIYLGQEKDLISFSVENGQRYRNPLVFLADKFLKIDFGLESLDLGFRNIPGLDYYSNNKQIVSKIIDEYIAKGYEIVCSTNNIRGLENVLEGRNYLVSSYFFEKGCVNNQLKILILSDYELFGQINLGGQGEWLKQIVPGDFLVHEDHGIGVFEGIVKKNEEMYIDIRYAGKDVLLVPISQNEKVSKYVGGKGRVPSLTTLNSGSWKRTKRKVKDDAANLAKELLQIYAMRKAFQSSEMNQQDLLKKSLDEFVSKFEFEDTFDQRVVTSEIFENMVSGILMDRLLVGDVGFGKTEVAMRAAFLALSRGMQVVVLAPTTILVSQHSSVFRRRLGEYGFRIETLSRLCSKKDREKISMSLESGEIDLVVGTHSLLNDSVKFKNLGLVIIDEEQKFGVKQKEKLRQKRVQSHVLSMSATPIPRSMSMSLSGIRDISMLFTPPKGRKTIKNTFKSFDWGVVKKAISKEIERGGQIYFIHNRVFDIHTVEEKLVRMFPELNIGVLHGQLNAKYIAKVMDSFCNRDIDILVSTTIIENGIDLPNVNTLIVDDASMYGLSQLYQIRGRIGRSNSQAYAYFLYKSMKGNAALRLDALMEAQDLGSGFLLASRDLEIRGSGDLLGSAQSGNINSVGYGLFMKYLSEAVEKLK